MDALSDFFTRNIVGVYFFYGLSFFSMGLGILLEVGHASELEFSRALRPLAGFGLVHGSHEWLEMFILINSDYWLDSFGAWLYPFRIFLLASSFFMLIAFGGRLISGNNNRAIGWLPMLVIVVIWLVGLIWVIASQASREQHMAAADVYTRYALAIPGAALTVWGLLIQRKSFISMGMSNYGRDVAIAALAFGLYGGIGQLFVPPSQIFPSNMINAELFLRWFGFPIQVFRASMATVAAIFIIRSLRAFEVENNRRIEALHAAQQTERRRLEALRGELLHRTVNAQESERQRIARELHDETGQTLTAIGMGLRGLADTIQENPQRAIQQAKQLGEVATSGVEELQRLIGGLHPPQLDDLGLLPALRWYSNEVKARYGINVQVITRGNPVDLPPDVRTVFFRVAQEAVLNIVRHAKADQASITLEKLADRAVLQIQDNGAGFNVEETLGSTSGRPSWGLMGMMERAALIGGECVVESTPGSGTCVRLTLSLERLERG